LPPFLLASYMGLGQLEVQILSPRFCIERKVVRPPNTSEKAKVAEYDLGTSIPTLEENRQSNYHHRYNHADQQPVD
jgi:hypothetical protein